MENYVRRLYYYTADTRDPAQSEVDFWVQALAEGDVTPAVLGQSFIFTTDKANSYTDAQAFYTMASYALLGTDVTTGNADAYLPYLPRAVPCRPTSSCLTCPPAWSGSPRWGWT